MTTNPVMSITDEQIAEIESDGCYPTADEFRAIISRLRAAERNAALDSICVELPQPMPSDDPYASYEGGWNDMRSEVQDALTAAGVHYK